VKSNRFCKKCSKNVVGCLVLMVVMMLMVCNTAFIYETCRGWGSSPDVIHICLDGKCIYRRKSVDLNHVCYITRLDKPLTQSKEW
jgi:hypothetical protein